MPRPAAGDPPTSLPPAPYQTPTAGYPAPALTTPFNYTNQPSLPAPTMSGTPTPAGLFNAFRRRWVLGTLIGLLAAAGTAVAVWMLLPSGKHQARALVQIRPRGAELGRNPDEFNEYRSQQVFLLKSRDLFTRTIADPAVGSLGMVKRAEDPVGMLEEHIRVKPVTDNILEVTMTGDNLDDMKVILDQLVKRYVDEATAFDRKSMDDRIKTHEQLAEDLRLQIDAKKREIDLLGRANNTVGGEDNAKRLAILQQRFIETEAAYNRLGRELGSVEAEMKVLREQLDDKKPRPKPDQVLVDAAVDRDPAVGKAKAAVDAKKREYEKALETAGGMKDVPYVMEKKAELDKLQAEYDEARKAATAAAIDFAQASETVARKMRLSQLDFNAAVKKEEREKLKEERDALQKLITSGVGGGLDIQAMRDQLKPQQELLDKHNATLATLRTDSKLGGRVSPRGDTDKVPNHNQNKKILFSTAGGVAGFLGVILLVAYLEWRTRRVDGVDQVVTELGMRVIGTVPAFPNRASLKAATEAGGANWRFVLNEAINSTRTMLLHTARAQSMQVVMVTSATQGEGKTSLASQLATSMATAGMRTLIVDCDLRNPSIQKLFDLPLGPGVSEVLRQEVDVSDAVQSTTVPNLWVIPAGQCSNTTIAALAQGHPLETLFNRLRGQFDFVIVDCCPVLPVADALLIGQHVDGVVFSIMQDISQLPKVMTASEKLHQLNIPLVGAVVNGIKQEVYSYGYNYVKQLPA
jgi:capsular exopolysaccharide synthesis family protein